MRFTLVPDATSPYYDEGRKAFAVEPGEFEVEVGASSQDIRLRGRVMVRGGGRGLRAAKRRARRTT